MVTADMLIILSGTCVDSDIPEHETEQRAPFGADEAQTLARLDNEPK
jgi:hypothetical protein